MEHYFTNNKNLKENTKKVDVKIKDTLFSFYTDNGVFNKKGLDYGTRVLLENINLKDKKSFLDVGCGCGPIGIYIAKQSENYSVDMIDINEKAVNLTNKGIKLNRLNNAKSFISNVYENIDSKYDMIITNPPIHAGKKVIYDIISSAKKYLNNNGEIWLVIRKDQGAKSLIKDMSDIYNIDIIKKDNGFYILQAKPIDTI
ncbi:MAG: class I SAM-dependent methyltransferase [Bacilli bacterium]|nr:class I SAM-dependent methyltransferase [Bacilli bacterium]